MLTGQTRPGQVRTRVTRPRPEVIPGRFRVRTHHARKRLLWLALAPRRPIASSLQSRNERLPAVRDAESCHRTSAVPQPVWQERGTQEVDVHTCARPWGEADPDPIRSGRARPLRPEPDSSPRRRRRVLLHGFHTSPHHQAGRRRRARRRRRLHRPDRRHRRLRVRRSTGTPSPSASPAATGAPTPATASPAAFSSPRPPGPPTAVPAARQRLPVRADRGRQQASSQPRAPAPWPVCSQGASGGARSSGSSSYNTTERCARAATRARRAPEHGTTSHAAPPRRAPTGQQRRRRAIL